MWTSATVTKTLFGFLLLNLVLVVTVALLRPVLAQQQPDEPVTATPEIHVPADPPSLPIQSDKSTVPPVSMPELSGESPAAPANKMVLDEIRKVIQDGRGELDVPQLSYPALPFKSNSASNKTGLQQLSQRMKSIAQLTQSAQALVAEAQQLHAAGQVEAASALTEHVQTIRSIIVQLAAEGSDSN